MEELKVQLWNLNLEEQKKFLVDAVAESSTDIELDFLFPFVKAASSFVKWRLLNYLKWQPMPDLLVLLPLELQYTVLSYLDGLSLLRATWVSTTWNRVIKNHISLWRKHCIRIGVNLSKILRTDDWCQVYIASLRQQLSLYNGAAFSQRYMTLQNCKKPVKAVDYKDGFLCSVSEEDYVNIWRLYMNIPVLAFPVDRAVSCIKFEPNFLLVCGHLVGTLTSWDLSVMSQVPDSHGLVKGPDVSRKDNELFRKKFQMHSGPVFSCDFSEKLDLLVSGGADQSVILWSLSSGVQIRSLPNQDHWVLKVVLLPDMSLRASHEIIFMTRDSVRKVIWPSSTKQDAQVDGNEGNDSSSACTEQKYGDVDRLTSHGYISLNEGETNFFTPGLHFSKNYIALIKQESEEKCAYLCVYNIKTFEMVRNMFIGIKVKKLIALGDRFALLLSTGTALYSSTLIIADLLTKSVAGAYVVPHSKMTTPDGAQLVVGDTEWLDGFGFHLPGPRTLSYEAQEELMNSVADTHIGTVTVRGNFIHKYVIMTAKRMDTNGRGLRAKEKERIKGIKAYVKAVGKTAPCSKSITRCVNNRCFCIYGGNDSVEPEPSGFLVLAAGILNEPGRLFTLWWNDLDQTIKCKQE